MALKLPYLNTKCMKTLNCKKHLPWPEEKIMNKESGKKKLEDRKTQKNPKPPKQTNKQKK